MSGNAIPPFFGIKLSHGIDNPMRGIIPPIRQKNALEREKTASKSILEASEMSEKAREIIKQRDAALQRVTAIDPRERERQIDAIYRAYYDSLEALAGETAEQLGYVHALLDLGQLQEQLR